MYNIYTYYYVNINTLLTYDIYHNVHILYIIFTQYYYLLMYPYTIIIVREASGYKHQENMMITTLTVIVVFGLYAVIHDIKNSIIDDYVDSIYKDTKEM